MGALHYRQLDCFAIRIRPNFNVLTELRVTEPIGNNVGVAPFTILILILYRQRELEQRGRSPTGQVE